MCVCVQLSVAQKRLDGSSSTESQRVWFQTQQERKQSRSQYNDPHRAGLLHTDTHTECADSALFFVVSPVSKALQEFDLALRGKKKRAKFLNDGKKKELTVSIILNQLVRQSVS